MSKSDENPITDIVDSTMEGEGKMAPAVHVNPLVRDSLVLAEKELKILEKESGTGFEDLDVVNRAIENDLILGRIKSPNRSKVVETYFLTLMTLRSHPDLLNRAPNTWEAELRRKNNAGEMRPWDKNGWRAKTRYFVK